MMQKLFLLLLFSLTLYANSDFERASALYAQKDYTQALKLFTKIAEKDRDSDAAYMLGKMYEKGEGTAIDYEASNRWYKISSKGYYSQGKLDPGADAARETRKLYSGIDKSLDKETLKTIKQYAESKYSIKSHNINYFIPASYRFDGGYPDTNGHQARNLETEFQISLKYNFYTGLFGLNEVYSIGYTQKSFWQLYETSAYFRETNYNPEVFVTIPTGHVKNLDYLKAIRLNFEHESNGRGGAEERSWNFIAASFYVQTGFLFTEITLWKDVLDSLYYNPNLMDYMGYGKVKFILPYKRHIFKFQMKNPFSSKRGSELNYSYPLFGSEDLFLYIKAFTGYGESLIDYNHKVSKLGIGFSISR
jgi:phospholipase A1